VHTHAAETCIGNRPQETSVTITTLLPTRRTSPRTRW
jgi:hypothetical protein